MAFRAEEVGSGLETYLGLGTLVYLEGVEIGIAKGGVEAVDLVLGFL